MTQTLDSLPLHYKQRVLCSYLNATGQVKIARIQNIPGWYFERVIFPGDRVLFEAVAEATLEIHTSQVAGTTQTDQIPCAQLRAVEKMLAV
ncbi:MAG: DUF1830 domain-containing protein [Aphanocapsa sp. GSE-SYN-MK-11-07L]|jgi:hypothetical protein|nr:DUF1830 domain-containing protein [Aphanocapsa sp. GSE-SYN-MK-11-07L]